MVKTFNRSSRSFTLLTSYIHWLILNFQSGYSWSLYWSILGRSLISTSLGHVSTDSRPTMATVTRSYYQWTLGRHSIRLLVVSRSTLGQYLGSHSVNMFLVNLRSSLGLYLICVTVYSPLITTDIATMSADMCDGQQSTDIPLTVHQYAPDGWLRHNDRHVSLSLTEWWPRAQS